MSVVAPPASDRDAPGTAFSAERAFEHVATIAQEPHPMGTAANATVRDYIVAELLDLGLEAELIPVEAPDVYGQSGSITVVNVVTRIPGSANTKAVALMAHYDTAPATPGANDNSTAVATLLETARALTLGPPVTNDVMLLFTDGEEPSPRFGSPALVADQKLLSQIGLVVNFETNGGSGPSLLAESSGPEGWLVGEYAAATPHPAAFSFLTEIVRLLGDIGTDFDVFRNAGVAGLHFAYLRGSPIYHTAADNLDAVGLPSLQHHGENALGIARHFGNLDLARAPDKAPSVFFTLRPFFVRYPSAWSAPLAILVVVVLGGTMAQLHRSRLAGAAEIAADAGKVALVGLGTAVAGTAAWMGIAGLRSMPGVIESYIYFGALVMSTAVVARWATARSRRHNPLMFAVGMVVIWTLLGLVTAFLLPGVSYLFLWPALITALVLLAEATGRMLPPELRFALIAGPAIVLLVPAIDTFLQMAQPRPGNPDSEILFAMFVPLVLALLAVGLAATVRPSPERGGTESVSDG